MDNSNIDASRPVRAKKTKFETTTKDSDTSQWPTKKKKKKLSGSAVVEASSNAVTTLTQLPVVLPTNPMKIKRLPFAESKNGSSQFHGPIKRPRGRPPLPTNRLKTGEKIETNTASSSSAASVPPMNPPKYTPLKGKVSSSASHKSKSHSKSLKSRPTIVPYLGANGIASYSNSSIDNRNNFVNNNNNNNSISSNKVLDSGHPSTGEKHSKTVAGSSSTSVSGKGSRPAASAVVHRVLSLLSVSDPISLTDLNAIICDAPKDLLQAVMDVLRVLGLVIYLKPVESSSSSSAFSFSSSTAPSSSSASSSSSIVAYTSSSSSSFPTPPPPSSASKAAALTPTGGVGGGGHVFALAEFAKGFNAIELSKIEEDIALKVTEIGELRERNAALQVNFFPLSKEIPY